MIDAGKDNKMGGMIKDVFQGMGEKFSEAKLIEAKRRVGQYFVEGKKPDHIWAPYMNSVGTGIMNEALTKKILTGSVGPINFGGETPLEVDGDSGKFDEELKKVKEKLDKAVKAGEVSSEKLMVVRPTVTPSDQKASELVVRHLKGENVDVPGALKKIGG